MGMTPLCVAIYARVSSEQQATSNTIDSQIAALEARLAQDGLCLPPDCRFIDDGYSGATLVRPALERLRDAVAAGNLDRLYVHSPDRLARRYAYQVLLIDEFHRAGVEVVFLNRPIGLSPEDDLLLQVQGMVAEYERAKILERSRRGKRHAARQGAVSVLSGAPYGYRYVGKRDGGGVARYEILEDEARIVRRIFAWIGRERVSIGETCRRLQQEGIRTRSGKPAWDRSTVWGILRNPAYAGTAAFGKTRIGPMPARLRPVRGGSEQPRRAHGVYDVAPGEWISVPVPPLVEEELFEAAREQLAENRRRNRQHAHGQRYLLQGLLVCQQCGYAYYGKAISLRSAKGKRRAYAYYRCCGSDAYRFGGERLCANPQVRTDRLDEAVWREVERVLQDPSWIAAEYERRLDQARDPTTVNLAGIEAQIAKLRRGMGRLIDGYAEGLIDKADFEPRVAGLRQRIKSWEEQATTLRDEVAQRAALSLVVGRLQTPSEGTSQPCPVRRRSCATTARGGCHVTINSWQPCCTRDEGRPLGLGLQDQGPNHRKLRRSNGRGGERCGKRREQSRQVCAGQTNVSEPLLTCRKRRDVAKTRLQLLACDKARRKPADWPSGDRHEDGVRPARGSCAERGNLSPRCQGRPPRGRPLRSRVPMRGAGADGFVVPSKPGNAGGGKGPDTPAEEAGQPAMGGAGV